MPESKEFQTDYHKLWQNLPHEERGVITFLAYSLPPVTIDVLSALSGVSAVKVLNVMEGLKRKRFVYEKKEFGKGTYFVNGTDPASFVEKQTSPEEARRALRRTIEFYDNNLETGVEKSLALAELHLKLGAHGEGIRYFKEAAEFFAHTGEREKSSFFYDRLIEAIAKDGVTEENVEDVLGGSLGKIDAARHLMPIREQIILLTSAERAAQRYENRGPGSRSA